MTTIEAYRLLDRLRSHRDLAVRLALLRDVDERLEAIRDAGIDCSPQEVSEVVPVLLSPEHPPTPDQPAGKSLDPRLDASGPPAELLARGLLALAGGGEGSLLVRAGALPVTCQRFSRDTLKGTTHMRWEASARDLHEQLLGELATAWLWRLHFTRNERGAAFQRRVLWPAERGSARIIADLALYAMQQAYGVDDAEVTFESVAW